MAIASHYKKCGSLAKRRILQRRPDGLVSHDQHVKVLAVNFVSIEQSQHAFNAAGVDLLVFFRGQHNHTICKTKKRK